MIRGIIIALALLFGLPAAAQSPTTQQQATIVVTSIETPIDALARTLAQELTAQLGKTFVVNNRTNLIDKKAGHAGSFFGAGREVARAKPDGNTLLLTTSHALLDPSAERSYRFDALRHISLLAGSSFVLVTGANSGYRTLRDLVQSPKRKPIIAGANDYGDIQTQSSIAISVFGALNRIEMRYVAYISDFALDKSMDASDVDIAAVPIDIVRTTRSVKDIRLLAIMDSKRSPLSPETPTLPELGFEPLHMSNYYILAVPAATPATIRSNLTAAAARAIRSDKLEMQLKIAGLVAYGGNEDLAEKAISAQRDLYASVRNQGASSATPRPQAPAAVAPLTSTSIADMRRRSDSLSAAERKRAGDHFRSAFESLSDGKEAIAARTFAVGLDLDPANAAARFYYGEALFLVGRVKDAIPQWGAARDLAPGTDEGRRARERLSENVR